MNTTPQLNFEHITKISSMPRDTRKNRKATIAWEHFYFVGFKIDSEQGERYHHALILADNYDTFLDGIAAEFLALLNFDWIASGKDISVVFIQNLVVQNPALVDKTGQAVIRTKSVPVPQRNSNAFTVVGITDTHKFCTIEVNSENALKAIDEANAQVNYAYRTRFKPLAINQINAAAIDFFNLLTTVVETVKELMGGTTVERGYLH